jgi:hypothetical protein
MSKNDQMGGIGNDGKCEHPPNASELVGMFQQDASYHPVVPTTDYFLEGQQSFETFGIDHGEGEHVQHHHHQRASIQKLIEEWALERSARVRMEEERHGQQEDSNDCQWNQITNVIHNCAS